MSEVSAIAAEPRDRAGKGAARATRRAGKVPGVIYGDKKAPVMIAVDPRVLLTEMRRSGFFTRLFDVSVGKDAHRVMARDVQVHPVTDLPLHVDFLRVGKDSKLHVAVPVVFINETKSPGLKKGGVLNVVRHDIDIVCTAEHLPKSLVVDLSGLDIGASIHISHIALPEGVVPTIADRDFTVATIAAPTVQRAGAEGEAEGEASA